MRAGSTGKRPKAPPPLREGVLARLAEGRRVRRNLPDGGRLHMDRPLPFLCVHRRPAGDEGRDTERLVTSEAAYLATGGREAGGEARALLRGLAAALAERFGGFLVLEVWAGKGGEASVGLEPGFRIHAPRGPGDRPFVEVFRSLLEGVRLRGKPASVEVVPTARRAPPGRTPLLSPAERRATGTTLLGLEIRPVYLDPATGGPYPLVLRDLRRNLSRALRRAFFEFSRTRTTHRPEHYLVLGRRAVVKAAFEVDRRLTRIADGFDFLMQVSPVNAREAWTRFQARKYRTPPVFEYRPLPFHPSLLKRRLFRAPVERIEDPVLSWIFRERMEELDRKITMLVDRDTPRFLLGSLQLFGPVPPRLLETALRILDRLPPRSRYGRRGGVVTAADLATRAREEIAHYRRQWPKVDARVRVAGDVAAGLMVSHGSLVVGKDSRIPASRVDALIQHEVGVHVLTWFNGRAQPFRILSSGLAGYDGFQEGLGVFSEYLAGGLSRARLRILAARVVASDHVARGAGFLDTFRLLVETHGFDRRSAFTVAMRVHRSGGYTKDAVYLSGLLEVVDYIGRGGDPGLLYHGKYARHHVPLVRELVLRKVLRSPPLTPRVLGRKDALDRLRRVREGMDPLELLQGGAS